MKKPTVVLLNNSRANDFSVAVKAKVGGGNFVTEMGWLLHDMSDKIAIGPGLALARDR